MSVVSAIRTLARLHNEKASIKRTSPKSAAFRKWQRASLKVLREAFGTTSSYAVDFREINFEIELGLVERAERTTRRIIRTDEKRNVVQIHSLPLPLANAKAHHFEQAVDRAAEILLSAKIELKHAPKGKPRSLF